MISFIADVKGKKTEKKEEKRNKKNINYLLVEPEMRAR